VAGFDLHPQVQATGLVDRSRLPRPDPRVRVGGVNDCELADDIDRAVRGAARGPDQVLLAQTTAMYVVDDSAGRGYAYVRADGRIVAIAATNDATATALLWQCLSHEPGVPAGIDHINAQQQWAVRVAIEAKLVVAPGGCVFWRGRTPPPGYLPDGAYL
jgi:hypothetical protein